MATRKDYTNILVKKDKVYENFNKKIKKLGLKKAETFRKLMLYFNKNPEKFILLN